MIKQNHLLIIFLVLLFFMDSSCNKDNYTIKYEVTADSPDALLADAITYYVDAEPIIVHNVGLPWNYEYEGNNSHTQKLLVSGFHSMTLKIYVNGDLCKKTTCNGSCSIICNP